MTKTVLLLSLPLLVLAGYAGIAHLAEMIPLPPTQTAPNSYNVRDRSDDRFTPDDQSESVADRRLTQWIRQAVMADMSLSTTAKHIKISTSNSLVTLRGPVNSPQESERIEAKAQYIAGMNKVYNQLEIIRPEPLTPQ